MVNLNNTPKSTYGGLCDIRATSWFRVLGKMMLIFLWNSADSPDFAV